MNKENTNNQVRIPAVHDGEVFTIGGMEFIKFPDCNGMTPVVMKDVAFRCIFGKNNNLKESNVLKRMQEEVLPKIIAAVGEENLCTIKTDLTTLDGLKPYGDMESKISLYTLDFYRANVEIFDQYKVDITVFLATPESAPPHDDPDWILCVSPSGYVYYDRCNLYRHGVRPFCIFKSSIFESSED